MSNVAKTALKGVTYYNPIKADDGYTLICPHGSKDMWLIDMEGNIVQHWRMPYLPGMHGRLLPSGILSYCGRYDFPPDKGYLPSGVGYEPNRTEFAGAGDNVLLEVDWDSNVLWQVPTPYQSHDFYPLDLAPGDVWAKNGHYLYPAYHPDGVMPDELAKKWQGGIPGTEYHGKIYADIVYEIDRQGKIVWEWKTGEHLDPELDAFGPLDTRANFHSNTVYPCRDGSILWIGRVLCQIHKVEYPSGKVIGRYGKGELFHQHDCRELPNGNILTLDNGSHRLNRYGPEYSRSVEIEPKRNKVVWQYKADPPHNFYTSVCAGSERLPNGNTLICEASCGRIFEVTHEGELVWEYSIPMWGEGWGYMNMAYRTHRYPRDYPAFKGRDLDPARFPWENRTYGPQAWKNHDFKSHIF